MCETLLILMVGLPYSGKSTWAVKQGIPIVSPDAIRLSLGHRFRMENEPLVWGIAKTMVESLFEAGHRSVILDATNTTEERRKQWNSRKWKTMYKNIKTTKEECLKRAGNDKEILSIIEKMNEKINFPTKNLLVD